MEATVGLGLHSFMDDCAENAEMLRGLSEYSVDIFHSFLLYAVFKFDLISTTGAFLVCEAIFIENYTSNKYVPILMTKS